MKNIINKSVLILSFLFLSYGSFAKDLNIEKDQVFQAIISEFSAPGANLDLYRESENYRFDLTLLDIVDKVSISLSKNKFQRYQEELNSIIKEGPLYFYDWYKKLKEIANSDEEFYEEINKKLYIQLYSKTGFALLPEYKFIDLQKIKDLGLLAKVKRYNEIVSSPEGLGFLDALGSLELDGFVTKKLTVTKMGEISRKQIKKVKKAYMKVYEGLFNYQYALENNSRLKYSRLSFQKKNSYLKAKEVAGPEGSKPRINFKRGVDVFNVIQSVPHKNALLGYLAHSLESDGIKVPRSQGYVVITPLFIENNWAAFKDTLAEFTLNQLVNLEDDEYLFLVRRWIKKNYKLIQTDLKKYNLDNDQSLSFVVKKSHRKPKRIEVLKQYDVLEKLFPTRPWMRKNNPDLIDRKGRAKYYDQTFGQKIKRKFKKIVRSLIKVENYTSIILGSATFIASAGNASLAFSLRSLVKKSVYTLKHDKEWKEFLLEAPAEVLSAFLLGSGFSPGRLYKILALGAGQGALQSYITGQDIKTGAIVGAGMNLINYYVLPYSLSKPMVKGFDAKSLRTNRLLEITATTVKNSMQGATVAALTGEDPLRGAIKGGIFGAVSAQLAIWFLGTRYHPFKDFNEQDVDDMLAAENNFQNDVGRGEYAIDRQMILDANYRVNGLLPKMISASITLPGNISMSGSGFKRLTTMTHEAHHLMQQNQSGVFGFYLFRYIPTAFMTGYDGHPDENFLRNFLNIYLN